MVSESDFFGAAGDPHRSSIPPNLSPGLCIAGKYELLRKIGAGAMGEVWAAKHISLDEEVAIKLVLRDVAHGDGSSADSRFLLEARVASQLSRKTRHIVSVTDHGEHGPYAYLAMELLAGESLDVRLARTGPLPLEKVIPLVYQVARALSVAHADGIVHRDLKPSNVFVTVDEEGKALVKILDFGIAKLRASMQRMPIAKELAETGDDGATDERAARRSVPDRGGATHATQLGFLLGTPAYMSPEQARGRAIDHRTDVWALAVIAYHLLTNEFPFDGQTPEELLSRLCRVQAVPITAHRRDLPPAVVDLFARAFARRIDDRFQSAVAFAGALEYVASAQQRTEGSAPRPMNAISLPPPNEVELLRSGGTPDTPGDLLGLAALGTRQLPSDRPKAPSVRPPPRPAAVESSIVAAGVPRKQKVWPRLFAGAAVLAVLFATASVLTVYFERDTTKATGHSTGASIVAAASPAIAARDDIPPPDPSAATPAMSPADLPAAPSTPVTAAALAPRPSPQVVTTTASLPPDPPPSATSPEAAPSRAEPSRRVDRSEVF